jgi:hypothetical protein
VIKIAINQNHQNKMPNLPPDEMRQWWNKFNGGFKNFNLPSAEMLSEAIYMGYAITAQHNGYRKADNFRCAQHVALDYDAGDFTSSIQKLLTEPFIAENASFLHSTFSHSHQSPRSRVVFILESPLYSKGKYSLLTEAFANTFTHADSSCQDPVRLFFGAQDCEVYHLGKTLTLDKAAEIVVPYKEKREEQRQKFARNYRTSITISSDSPYLERMAQSMVNRIMIAPDGQKWNVLGKVSLAFGGYVAAGYFEETEIAQLLYDAITSRDIKDSHIAQERIEWGLRAGQDKPLYLEEDKDPVLNRLFNG